MEIYMEGFIIENLLADGAIAFLTFMIWKEKAEPVNLAVSAGVMTLSSFFVFIPVSGVCSLLAMKILISLAIVKIMFPGAHGRAFWKRELTFIGVSAAMGGMVSFIVYSFGIRGVASLGIIYVEPAGYLLLVSAIGVSFIFMKLFFHYIAGFLENKRKTAEITVYSGNRVSKLKGIVDTGNFLKDPIDSLPVILGEAEAMRDIFDTEREDIRYRIVPYSSVGETAGVLLGIKADKVLIVENGREYTAVPAVVAAYEGKFNLAEGCNAILHPDIMKRED